MRQPNPMRRTRAAVAVARSQTTWVLALAALLVGFAATWVRADEPALCDRNDAYMAELCGVVETFCLPYLDSPGSLNPDALSPVPKTFRRYFEGTLSTHAIGYQETRYPEALVVYMYDEPACEILVHGLSYSELLSGYAGWRKGPGARFVATSGFEPLSRITMDRAYAATFLAAPRRDGRVTEITFNWNLTFEGLTRFRISYQPLRPHTRDLMQVDLK